LSPTPKLSGVILSVEHNFSDSKEYVSNIGRAGDGKPLAFL
jgi:hypothetical protein